MPQTVLTSNVAKQQTMTNRRLLVLGIVLVAFFLWCFSCAFAEGDEDSAKPGKENQEENQPTPKTPASEKSDSSESEPAKQPEEKEEAKPKTGDQEQDEDIPEFVPFDSPRPSGNPRDPRKIIGMVGDLEIHEGNIGMTPLDMILWEWDRDIKPERMTTTDQEIKPIAE